MGEGLESKSESPSGSVGSEGPLAEPVQHPEGPAQPQETGAVVPDALSAGSARHAEPPAPVAPATHTAGALSRFFLMREALEAAEHQAFGGSAARLAAFRQAAKSLEAAEVLLAHAPDARESACVVLREALLSAAQAVLPEAPRTAPEAWVALASGPGQGALGALSEPERAALQRAFLVSDGAAAPADPVDQRLAALRRGVRALITSCSDQLRPVARVRLTRALRWAVALLLPVVVLAGGVGLSQRMHRQSNLALRKPVTASSRHPKHPKAEGAVDGKQYGIGVHTNEELRPWLQIDLQAVQRVRQIVVYNSDHCCFENAVPLIIEVSTDGKAFRPVARRDRPFGVWEADLAPTDARYVKLHVDKSSFLHLSEVEVR